MSTIVPATPDTQYGEPPHPRAKHCPACGQEATTEGQQRRADGDPIGVATVYYVCDNAHLWSLRWFVAVGA